MRWLERTQRFNNDPNLSSIVSTSFVVKEINALRDLKCRPLTNGFKENWYTSESYTDRTRPVVGRFSPGTLFETQ
jgi:hypothetical protein